MTTRNLISTVALGSLLPIAVWGQTSTSSSTGSNAGSNMGSSNYSSSDTSSMSSQGNHNSSDIHRVTNDSLENRLTAKSLIGTKVVDRDGKEIGEVKDIGLASIMPDDLKKSSQQSASNNNAVSRAANEVSQFAQRASKNPNVYVSVGGFMGMGDDLVAIPADELKRDGDNLRIDRTRAELKSIAKTPGSQYSSSE